MLEPPRSCAEKFRYSRTTPNACDGVVRVGSKRFDVLEPPRSSAEAPSTPG